MTLDRPERDGIPGRRTTAAVRQFQADRKLAVKYPGTVGPITLAALGLLGDTAPEPGVPVGEVVPPWFSIARSKIGLYEKIHNKTLRDWLKSDGHTLGDPAQLPWCGGFLDALEVWLFDWISGGSGYGVIAQQAREVFPDAISEDEDGYLQADYSKYVPLLIREVKELRARMSAMERTT